MTIGGELSKQRLFAICLAAGTGPRSGTLGAMILGTRADDDDRAITAADWARRKDANLSRELEMALGCAPGTILSMCEPRRDPLLNARDAEAARAEP
jgi:hypothetical protein